MRRKLHRSGLIALVALGAASALGTYAMDVTVVAEPTGFFVDTPTHVRIQAQVLPNPDLDTSSVKLFRLVDSTTVAGDPLCNLLDNGDLANGDDIFGDSVFSCFVDFVETEPTDILLLVTASVADTPVSSLALRLNAVAPLTDAEVNSVVDGQLEAATIWEQALANFGDTLEARMEAATAIARIDGVQGAGVSSDDVTIWIDYESGVTGGLMLNPAGTRGRPGSSRATSHRGQGTGQSRRKRPNMTRAAAAAPSRENTTPVEFHLGRSIGRQADQYGSPSGPTRFTGSWDLGKGGFTLGDEDIPVGNNNVLIWDAYNSEFAPDDEGPAIRDLFQDSVCPPFNVTYLIDGQCTVSTVSNFTQYGTIVMVTHGAVDKNGQVVFLTRSEADFFGIVGNMLNLVLGRLTIMGDVFAVRPSFVSSLSGGFDEAIVYNGSCQSSANATMSNAFVAKGTQTYYGFTKIVNSDFAEDVATQLFTNLVENLANTGEAFDPVTPKIDPKSPFAVFTQDGDEMTAYSGKLQNGSFEKGTLGAWTNSGDGRVIASLGSFSPPEGEFMGIISTGLGFTTSSGTIAQQFCLPANATSLNFDWNFYSEEFIEWCGPQYPFDDPFVVELVTEAGTNVLLQQTVDTLCGGVAATDLFFDQSGPACTPTSGVGMGTGGNDCTVWNSGWRTESIDISGIAVANDGKGVTLRFRNFDEGDSIFDSAVTLDRIAVIQP